MVAMRKKFVPLVLALTLIVSLFAGCAGKESVGGGDNGGKSEAQNETQTESSSGGAENLDPLSKEYAEQVFEEFLADVETPEYFKNTETFEYTFQFGDSTAFEDTFGERFFEKKFNVKANFIRLERENRKEQINLLFATGTTPDLIMAPDLASVSEYSGQGLLAEIPEELVKENMPGYYKIIQDYSPGLLNEAKVNGKAMGLPRLTPNGGVPKTAAIRSDWLKNVGITKVPTTLDELEEAFIKFRNEDPDQNGQKDTYAISNPSDFAGNLWFQSIFGAYGANPFLWVEKNGELQFGLTTEEVKQALKRLHSWYEMELIDPEFITDKGRSLEVTDLTGKFAEGKIGYIDHLNADDYQWDNDGQINYKWLLNHEEWAQWFEERADNPEEYYSISSFTDFDDSVIQPIYINLPPVEGPGGSGYYRPGYNGGTMVFGKQLEEQPEKLEKLLKILEYLNQDHETYLTQSWGPPGFIMEKNEAGELVYNPAWTEHELYDAVGSQLGAIWTTNPMRWTNPEWLGLAGGPREEQRYKKTLDMIREYPAYEDKLKTTLPSQTEYSELLDTRVKEYVIKAVAGDLDIDATFDDMVKQWYDQGGEQLTKEANEWYNSIK